MNKILKYLFNYYSSSLLFNKNNFTFNEGLPIIEKPKKSFKSTMLKISFAAAALLMLTTTGSSSLNKGLPVNNNEINKTQKDEEEKGTKMYVYGTKEENVPRGIFRWTGNKGINGENIYLAFSSLPEDFQNEYGLDSLGTLRVPMFYMRDSLEPGKPPVYYVSEDPKDGHLLGPVALEDAEIYVVIDNLTGKTINFSYKNFLIIKNSHNLRYTPVGPCTKYVALKHGASIDIEEVYRDFAQNTVVDAFVSSESLSNTIAK